ncbi:MAG: hypothetical protein SPH83_03525 [Treponema sp.]|nr:hypothetical protein [Treponema sp.]
MKKKLVIMVLALLCATKICSFEYKLEDILLTYMAFIEHSNLFINRVILFLNPNQNSRIHYAEYEFDSGGNKILKVFDSEMDFEKNESYDSVYYKNNRISGVRCGHNRWNFKIENGNLIIKENEWRPLSYEMHYVSENELRCYGKKITKNGNEFTVDDYEPYKFIFNDDSIEVIKLSKAGDELYKYIYDNHGILLKEFDCHNYDSERLVWSTNGVNGFITEVHESDIYGIVKNDDYFRRIDKDGYLVYQNDDYSENNHYGYRELIILPCDEEDNILATVDDVAIPYPEKKKDLEENEATEIPELNHTIQGEKPVANVENEPKVFSYKGVLLCFIFSMTVIVVILIISKRNKNAKK